MAKEETVVQDINPKDPNKTYGLMELMKGRAPLVDKGGPEESLFSWPHLMLWLTVVFLGLLIVLVGISWIANAPLREPFDTDLPENPAKAPWYFLNLQELLLHMDKTLAGVIVPTVVLGATRPRAHNFNPERDPPRREPSEATPALDADEGLPVVALHGLRNAVPQEESLEFLSHFFDRRRAKKPCPEHLSG